MSERPTDVTWDILEEIFGPVRTRSERSRRNRAVMELREAGASVEEIRQTHRYCRHHYTSFSEMAICTNLTRANSKPPTSLPDQLERLRQEKTQ